MEAERLRELQEKARKYDILKKGYKNAAKEIERLQEENEQLHEINAKLWAQLDAIR